MAMGEVRRTLRIGVDVGGTNTDAVILDVSKQASENRGVLAHFKTPTTPEVTEGIETAVETVLKQSNIPREQLACVTIGTTHFINALLEQDARRLKKVAIIRLSKSFLRDIPPFSEFPTGLASLINGYYGYVDGGIAIDGSEESPVVESQVVEQCMKIKELKLKQVVVAGVFSPIDEAFEQEHRVRDIVLRELPGVDVVCSRDVANIGFMERENAAILNASILTYARRTVRGFRSAIKKLGLTAPIFLTQNDGTLVESGAAAELPIRTFSSGPTNSMRGAAYLAGMNPGGSSTVVVDVGGTTSDLGVLLPSGFPRQASAYVSVAGVKINYSMPHLHSIGLGGGSVVQEETSSNESSIGVGPESVGNYLLTEAKVFGGKTLTATDIAVASKKAIIGNVDLVRNVSPDVVSKAQARIKTLLERAIDVVKTSPEPLPVLLVGGGSIIVPNELKGAATLIRPPYHDVANAVGAAMAKVGGTVDIVQNTSKQTAAEALEHAKDLARKRAVEAGADKGSVTIAEVDQIPLQYVANQVRTIVKAVGELDLSIMPENIELDSATEDEAVQEEARIYAAKTVDEPPVDPTTYRPKVLLNEKSGIPEWHVSETDLNYLADGCYVLGCAGGGSPASTVILLRDQLRAGYRMRIIDASGLTEKANIYWGGHMGSPAVSVERLASTETVSAFRVLMEYLREDSFDAVMGLEIGGANGMEPLLVGSSKYFDRPVIDGDWMGRAYPTYWQTTLAVHDPGQLVPCAIDSGDGKSIVMVRTSNDEIVDRALRASCAEMGSRVGMAARPTTTDRVRKHGVLNTCSLAWRIGRAIAIAEATNTLNTVAESIIHEVGGDQTAKILFRGKIIAVERRLHKGHSYGTITVAGLAKDEEEEAAGTTTATATDHHIPALATDGLLTIPFKNENIYAQHTSPSGTTAMLATVPDLISVLDTGSGRALGVPEYKYGARVTVLGITCCPRWTDTEAGLRIGGPAAFGYDIPYRPLGVYREPRSVVLEFAPGM